MTSDIGRGEGGEERGAGRGNIEVLQCVINPRHKCTAKVMLLNLHTILQWQSLLKLLERLPIASMLPGIQVNIKQFATLTFSLQSLYINSPLHVIRIPHALSPRRFNTSVHFHWTWWLLQPFHESPSSFWGELWTHVRLPAGSRTLSAASHPPLPLAQAIVQTWYYSPGGQRERERKKLEVIIKHSDTWSTFVNLHFLTGSKCAHKYGGILDRAREIEPGRKREEREGEVWV